jgi:hypothetical protein
MTRISDHRSILAIDPGSRGLAFVFFENGTLLDWGTRGRGRKELAVLDAMLARFKADLLVLEDPDAFGCERRARIRRLLGLMAKRAMERGVVVEKVSRYAVRRAWRERDKTNKHEVAAAIADMFPEIEPYVPRERRTWDSEDPRTGIFDAVSLVLEGQRSEMVREATSGAPSASVR